MKKTILTTAFVITVLSVFAQNPIWKSVDTASSNGAITTLDYAFDKKGNHYLTGYFSGKAQFGKHTFTANSVDAFVLKVNNKGLVEWAEAFTGQWQVQGVGIAVDTSGNVFVSGSFQNSVTINGSGINTGGSTDGFLVKMDKDGKYQWHQLATGTSVQTPAKVVVDSDGNAYWTGTYFGSSSIAGKSISNVGSSYDCYLVKVMSSGKASWVKAYGGSSVDQVADLAHDGDKSLVVTGSFFSSITIDSKTINGSGNYDIYVARFDSTGKYIWGIGAGGTSSDLPSTIAWDNNGGFVLGGTFTSQMSIGGKTISGGSNDMFLARVNKSLKADFAVAIKRTGTGFGSNAVSGIAADSDDGVIVAGTFSSAISFKNKTYTPVGTDIFVARVTEKGVPDWINTAGGNSTETVAGFYLDQDDIYHMGGIFTYSCDFGSISLTGKGSTTVYTASGLPSVTAPDYKGKKTLFVYPDSTLSRSYDLKLKTDTDYEFLSGPSGMTYDSATVSITWKPSSNDVGKHQVRIRAENIAGIDTAEITVWVISQLSLQINSPDTACFGEEITISYEAPEAGPVSALWHFSDGSDFLRESIDYTFKKPGTYTVGIRAQNFFGDEDTAWKTIEILPLPQANFKKTNACVKDTLLLTDNSSIAQGSITQYAWYADGVPASSQNSVKAYYGAKDTINYSLVVYSAAGCKDSIMLPIRITEKPNARFAAFNACQDADALFFDQSTTDGDTVVLYEWSFGDGGSASVPYSGIAHVYKSAGNYNVSLKVTTSNNCSDDYSSSVKVYSNPIPKFSVQDLCGSAPISLTDNSNPVNGTIKTRIWDFGDGKFDSKKTVSHKYTASGKYNISLVVSNTNGCSDTLTQTITVYPSPSPKISVFNRCANSSARLTADAKIGSTDSVALYSWAVDGLPEANSSKIRYNFSDTSKEYMVTLAISTKAGCYDSTFQLVKPLPFVSSTFSVDTACIGDTLPIIGDLSAPSLDSVFWIGWGVDPVQKNGTWHVAFKKEIGHQLFLRTFSSSGCEDSSYTKLQTHPYPESDFEFLYLGSNKMQFTPADLAATTYHWDFGDGTTSTDGFTSHTYSQYGTYTVVLTTTNDQDCSASTLYEVTTSTSVGTIVNDELRIEVYPNPANEYVVIAAQELFEGESSLEWIIADIAGRTLLQGTMTEQTTISVQSLPAGTYSIQVRSDRSTLQKMLIVE